MKKLTAIIIILFICIQITPAHAALEFTVEPIGNDGSPNMNQNDPPGTFTINGTTYLWPGAATSTELIEYNPKIYDFIKNENSGYKYIWTGQYYMGRYAGLDNAPSQYREAPIYAYSLYPVKLYDSELNLIKQHTFTSYVYDIGYFNGNYYCQMGWSSSCVKSSDFETWERTDEETPRKIGSFINCGGKISFDGTTLNNVNYENKFSKMLPCNCGTWNLYLNADKKSFSITNDNIYFINLNCQQDVDLTNGFMNGKPYVYVYESEDDLVVDLIYLGNSYRLTTPKQPVFEALEAQKSAPYVCVNNTILGFETPPVTESDRTLVPMRFLFEQLGAEVSWDEATETATAVKANTTINFSIDNTTATVNGAATTMDVPARLVGDKTMVPLRFLSEEMGYTVEWDEETRMATITTPLVSRMAKAETTDVFGEWIR